MENFMINLRKRLQAIAKDELRDSDEFWQAVDSVLQEYADQSKINTATLELNLKRGPMIAFSFHESDVIFAAPLEVRDPYSEIGSVCYEDAALVVENYRKFAALASAALARAEQALRDAQR